MRISFKALGILLASCVGLQSAALAQQGSGVRYKVTSKMEMAGMPFAMPARSMEVCGPKNAPADNLVPRDKNCSVLDYRVVGNKSSFRMVCTGKDAMTGTGEFEMLGAKGYRGKMTMATDGEQMVMNFDGQRLGDCDYAKEGPQAQANAMIGKSCGQMLTTPVEGLVAIAPQFTAPGSLCLAKKAPFCSKLVPLSTNAKFLREQEVMEAGMRKAGATMPSQWDAFQGCGMSRTSLLAKSCAKAEASNDFDFIGVLCPERLAATCERADPNKGARFLVDRCPARAKQLAAQQCAGRGYTAMSTSPYRDFCNAYAGAQLEDSNGEDHGSTPGKAGEKAPKKPSFRDRLKSLKDGVIGG